MVSADGFYVARRLLLSAEPEWSGTDETGLNDTLMGWYTTNDGTPGFSHEPLNVVR